MTQVIGIKDNAEATHVGAGYRPDIEGLRAVAILLVFLTHAGWSGLEGGYVGVDVFFVISGFLITQMLVREVRSTGRLRMRRFYARRARRLLPASAAVLVASAALTWAFLPQNRWASTAYDIMASAVYAINWRLAEESVNYLRADSAPSIVQHFWSLAVEEQFYILWPLLLIAAAFFARLTKRRNLNGSMLIALAMVGIPSLAWSIYYTEENPARAYFVSTTRVWELALGAAVAILAVNGRSLPRGLAFVVGWAGMAAIVAAGVMFTPEFPFPGYWALVPTLGSAAVIAAGLSAEGRTTGSVGWMLGKGPMEATGRLSYSLYLCHWPMLVVATAMLGGELPVTVGLVVVFSSFIPAYLLHHHIENPIRFSRSRLMHSGPMLQLAAITTAISLTAGMVLWIANWPPAPPFVPPSITKIAAVDAGTPGEAIVANLDPSAVAGAGALGAKPLGDANGEPRDTSVKIVPPPEVAAQDFTNCTQTQESSEIMSCTYGKEDSTTVVALIGDSHANQWAPGIAEIAQARGWKVVEYTKAACSFADVLITTKDGHPYPSCREWSTALLDRLLTTDKPTMVITSSIKKRVMINGQANFDAENISALAAGLRHNYEALNKAGIPVVVIQDTPLPEFDIPECVQQNTDKLTECAGDRSKMVPGDLGAEQFEAKAGLDNVHLVDLNGAICPAEKCAAVIGNVLVYRDASHLTGTYVRSLVPRLAAELELAKQ